MHRHSMLARPSPPPDWPPEDPDMGNEKLKSLLPKLKLPDSDDIALSFLFDHCCVALLPDALTPIHALRSYPHHSRMTPKIIG